MCMGEALKREMCVCTLIHTHKYNDVNYPLEAGPILILRAYLSNFRDVKTSFL